MTKKRFRLVNHDEYDYELDYIMDNYKRMHISDVCDLLNTFNEENEYLKQAYNDAKKDVEKKEQILKDIMEDNLLIQDIKKELQE